MIDHIVYVTQDLEAGIREITRMTGVSPVYGGKHPDQGTHNALMAIGDQQYLEILSPDPDNQNVSLPRWMGVDLPGEPTISRWAVKSDNIRKDVRLLANIDEKFTHIKEGRRKTSDGKLLTWELSVPLPAPRIEAVPFLIDWKDSAHPASSLNCICRIATLQIYHPNPENIAPVLQQLQTELSIFPSDTMAIRLTLECPNGLISL